MFSIYLRCDVFRVTCLFIFLEITDSISETIQAIVTITIEDKQEIVCVDVFICTTVHNISNNL